MEEKITKQQPNKLCQNCLRLANDPVLNCPTAQEIREGKLPDNLIRCDQQIPLEVKK
jgi:hypothetical protein